MRTISPLLKADIDAGTIASLLKISCTNGTVYGFTDHELPITIGGVTYTPAPGLEYVKYTATSDVQVSNQEVGAAMVDVPEEDLIGGVFDSADVEAAWCSWKNPSYGQLITFKGKIGEVSWSEVGFIADIVSFMKQLERNIGYTYTSSCRHELFGTGGAGKIGACGLSAGAFTHTGTISSISINKWKFVVSVSQADNYFSNGQVTFTSGNNAGLSATIKKQTGTTIELLLPTAFGLQVGDGVTLIAGCDKTLETCKTKFSNAVNFGGFPHINTDIGWR